MADNATKQTNGNSSETSSNKSNLPYIDGSIITKEKFLYILMIHLILENGFILLNIANAVFLVAEYNPDEREFWYSVLLLSIPWISMCFVVWSGNITRKEDSRNKEIGTKFLICLL